MVPSHESDLDELAIAFAAVGLLIRGIEPDRWASPTPCTEWPVRRLVTHLVGMNLVFAAMLADEPAPARVEISDRDLPREYETSADLLVARFSAPGALERVMSGPLGSSTGRERLMIRLYDLLAHGWDLAQAIRQPLILPDGLAERSLAFATLQLEGINRDGRFQAPQACSDQADSLERLVAFLGRDVAWAPPSASEA